MEPFKCKSVVDIDLKAIEKLQALVQSRDFSSFARNTDVIDMLKFINEN